MPRLLILAHAAARRPRLLRGRALKQRFPELEIDVADHFSKATPLAAERRHPAHLRPDDARRGVRQCAQAEMGAGARHRRRRHHRPAARSASTSPSPTSAASTARRCRKPRSWACWRSRRDLPRSVRSQDQNSWTRWPPKLLDNKTVGIYGIGLIAEALAPRCKAFGMTVDRLSRRPSARCPASTACCCASDLIATAKELDYLVAAGPLLRRDAALDRRATCSPP